MRDSYTMPHTLSPSRKQRVWALIRHAGRIPDVTFRLGLLAQSRGRVQPHPRPRRVHAKPIHRSPDRLSLDPSMVGGEPDLEILGGRRLDHVFDKPVP